MKRRTLLNIGLSLAIMSLSVTSAAANNTSSVQVIVSFKVKNEKLKSFLTLMKDVKKNLPVVDGCNGVNVYQNKDDKYSITLVESWKSVEKHKAHIKHVVDSGDWKYISSHLVQQPQSNYYHEL